MLARGACVLESDPYTLPQTSHYIVSRQQHGVQRKPIECVTNVLLVYTNSTEAGACIVRMRDVWLKQLYRGGALAKYLSYHVCVRMVAEPRSLPIHSITVN